MHRQNLASSQGSQGKVGVEREDSCITSITNKSWVICATPSERLLCISGPEYHTLHTCHFRPQWRISKGVPQPVSLLARICVLEWGFANPACLSIASWLAFLAFLWNANVPIVCSSYHFYRGSTTSFRELLWDCAVSVRLFKCACARIIL